MAADRARYRPQPRPRMRRPARLRHRHQPRHGARRKTHPEDFSALSSFPIRLGTWRARPTSRKASDRDPRNRRRRRARRMAVSRHHAAAGHSGRGRRGRRCRKRTRSASSPKSARPLPRCSAPRSARWPGSSRTGALSCAGKSRDAAPGTSASDCRRNFCDGLDELLRDAAALIPLDRPPVILTGEYIPENFLLSRDGYGLAPRGLDRFRRRDDGEGRIRPAGSERLHDRRHAAAGAKPV